MTDTDPPPTDPVPVTVVSDLLFADRVVDAAEPWAERYWPDPDLAAFLFPHEALSTELKELHDLWACEVFAFRCWCAAILASRGTPPSVAALPYGPHSGAIAGWLPNLGDSYAARETREHHKPLDPPQKGDVVLMQHPSSPHASVITDGGAIDGGQVRENNGAIKGVRAKNRIYRVEGGELVARDVDGVHSLASPGPAAPVLWIMRAALVQI